MSLVKYGGGIIQMSGSIAGNTFARNRSGNYVRARTKPVNPNTSSPLFGRDPGDLSQNKIRAALATLTTRWARVLTAAQRIAWNLYASNVAMKNRLGEVINLTGFNHYIRSNSIHAATGGTIVDAGPTVFELPEKDPTISVVPQTAEQRTALTFDDTMEWVDEAGAVLFIFGGQPQNPQRNFFAGPYLGVKDKIGKAADPITSPQNFTNFHILAEGQKVWYKFRIRRADGRISEPFYANGIVIVMPA